jgi:outer membrane immunogenic protein
LPTPLIGKTARRTTRAGKPQQGFNTVTTTTATTTGGFHTHVTILRVGLNYRFRGPIVAKY